MDKNKVFNITTDEEFNAIALKIFSRQASENLIYKKYIDLLNIRKEAIQSIRDIPFLPIEFFKNQDVIIEGLSPAITFTSSGTSGMVTSRHYVPDISWYEQSFRTAFNLFYGDVKDMAILALLPSYLEREGSSLIYMVDDLMKGSQQAESNYFLYNHQELAETLSALKQKKTKTILIGVTYALLDFIESYQIDFPELIVMETGGMKGKRKEMIRQELHQLLCKGFGVDKIHSEYGMTELLSQGYSRGDGLFETPPWMKILTRDTNDPLTIVDPNQTGIINVIDLANYHSCSFIATQDLGKVHGDGKFEVLGRFDHADIRGCNLLVQ